MSSSRTKPVEILLIEDHPADVLLVQQALQEIEIPHHLMVSEDGEQALAYLRREEPFASATAPDIVLLDLGLAKKDSLAVLAALKDDRALCHILVILLTDSQDLTHLADSYRLHASSYIVKPATLDRLCEVIKVIETFWFRVAQLFEDETTTSAPLLPEPPSTNGTQPLSFASDKER